MTDTSMKSPPSGGNPLLETRRTKIVATLGPASNTHEVIRALALAGANVFRMNFSHGTHSDHEKVHQIIRSVEHELSRPIAILADLQGPKLRVATFEDGAATLIKGQSFTFCLSEIQGTSCTVTLPHPEIFKSLQSGDYLLVDDGKIRLRAVSVTQDEICAEVVLGGAIRDRKGVNLPDRALDIPALTIKDRNDLSFALDLGVDWVALSFVQKAADIDEVRAIIGTRAKIVAKIEKPVALKSFPTILQSTDAVMVARGDLGVECDWNDVPTIQKNIVEQCRAAGKPVIVATQMLESMISSPVPTRAEVSDVANAIFEGADAVMLSAESAAGEYPLEAVAAMASIAASAEQAQLYWRHLNDSTLLDTADDSTSIASAACLIAHMRRAYCIVTYTESGATALRVAKSRPDVAALAICPSWETARSLALVWGISPTVSRNRAEFEQFREGEIPESLSKLGNIPPDRPIVVTSGSSLGVPGGTDSIKIAYIDAETSA